MYAQLNIENTTDEDVTIRVPVRKTLILEPGDEMNISIIRGTGVMNFVMISSTPPEVTRLPAIVHLDTGWYRRITDSLPHGVTWRVTGEDFVPTLLTGRGYRRRRTDPRKWRG